MPAQKARCWTITVKNWDYFDTQDWETEIQNQTEPDGSKIIRYLSIGKHTGQKTGYQHCHMNLELEKPKTLFWIKNTLFMRQDIHCEPRKGTREQCNDYLNKDGYFREIINTRTLRPGKRTDLEDIKEMIEDGATLWDCYQEHFGTTVRCEKGIRNYIALRNTREARQTTFDAPQVIVYVGPAGSGKSWHCNTDKDYIEDGYRFPVQMDAKIYFDGYDNQKTIWFDEFSGKAMQFTKFCQLADRYPGRYETKGGTVFIFGLKKILISTIQYPSRWWAGSERFNTDPEQLFRRLTKCYYVGSPRRTSNGDLEYAVPLEFNPRELRTRDDEDILRRNVKYPSDLIDDNYLDID
ncbi:replication-associated protein [Macochavirus kuci]|uniref:Replication-associated protein n=1 Tax=Porcine associated circular DNA virus-3 TaxID=2853798 RepID=A0A8F4S8K9_9VIRU|nr:replication-associated protein [Porcine associated circular DNA virus-3]